MHAAGKNAADAVFILKKLLSGGSKQVVVVAVVVFCVGGTFFANLQA